MGELGELRNKVDQAVDSLSTAHETRRRQSHGLMTLLTDLETKFEARNEEVEHSKQRIEALARENADLSNLVDRLVQIIDTTVNSEDEDTLFRASATAAELVADWPGPGDRAETVDQQEGTTGSMDDATSEIEQALREPEITAFDVADDEVVWSANNNGELDDLIAAELGYDTATEAFTGLGPALRFEDVSEEELASEQLDGDPGALAALINAPLTSSADDDADVQKIDEPFEVPKLDDHEAAPVLASIDTDIDGIDMPEIDMTDVDLIDIDTTLLDASDTVDPIQERLAADLDIPEIAFEDDEPISRIDPDEDTESSIRAMMSRLEQAAARANAHTKDSPEPEADEAPAVAVGGAS